jgi:hypothetical protein
MGWEVGNATNMNKNITLPLTLVFGVLGLLFAIVVIRIVVKGSNTGKTTPISETSPTSTPSLYAMLQDESYRASFAKVAMEQSHYLRDPDSLVIESVNKCSKHTFGGADYLVFVVSYRAKNGFGGYVQNKAWILCGTDGGKLQVLSDGAYNDFCERGTQVPADPLARHNPKESISELKSLLNKPSNVWAERYGKGTAELEGVWKWEVDRMEVKAFFLGEKKLASFVVITVPYGQRQLTLAEAKQIVTVLGLTKPKTNPTDRLTTEWGKEGDQVSAVFDGNEGEHSLQVTTSLYKFGPDKTP